MAPDPRDRKRQKSKGKSSLRPPIKVRPSSDDPHKIVYFQRHREDDHAQAEPGREFLKSVPTGVRAKMRACLNAVAAAPPKRFAGGGYWEAMHGEMSGWFEIRVDGPNRSHYRLFCRLDYEARGEDRPLLVVVTGMSKAFRTTIGAADYAFVRVLGEEYFARNPRSWS